MEERQARSQLGKWRKSLGGADGGDGKLLALIADCEAKGISDPNTYLEQAVRNSAAPADNRQAFLEQRYANRPAQRTLAIVSDDDE